MSNASKTEQNYAAGARVGRRVRSRFGDAAWVMIGDEFQTAVIAREIMADILGAGVASVESQTVREIFEAACRAAKGKP